MIAYFFAALLGAAVQPISQVAPQEQQPVIWRDLRKDITPEQFAEALKKVDGVKSVDVTRKGTKPAKIKIAYSLGNGLQIGDLNVSVTPSFIDNHLDTVNLSETGCYSAIIVKIDKLVGALGEKYPQQQRVKVVSPDGVSIDTQRAFYNEETRVTLSAVPIDNPYPRYVYGGSGFIAAANKLANSLADSTYNSAIEACPSDKGRKATLQLDYVSQKHFMLQHNKEDADRAAKAKATKDGL
jgi:copper chaperone CopZ